MQLDIFFDIFMFPLEVLILKKLRKNSLGKVQGDTLEIGCGTGVNLKYYNYSRINSLTLMDLNISERVKKIISNRKLKVDLIEGSTEKLPFASGSFDSVVFTLVFCSVDYPLHGLQEICRVLKPGGKIYFIEHVLPKGRFLKSLVNRANPIWLSFSKNCNINRQTIDVIKTAGFKELEYTGYVNSLFISGTGSCR